MFAMERHDPRRADLELIALATGASLLLAGWLYPLWQKFYPISCPMKSIFGIPCAFCGGTRAVHAWSHGHFLEAWLLNPLVASGSAALSLYLLYAIYCVLRRPPHRIRVRGFTEQTPVSFRWVLRGGALALVLGNWIYLIAVGR